MKKTVLAVAAAFVACFAAAPASAQLYGGAGLTVFQVDDGGEDLNFGAAMGRLGWEFNPFLAVEGEAAFGIADDEVDVLGQSVDVGVDSEYGAFVVGKLPLAVVDLFGRIGYASMNVEADALGTNFSEDGDGLAYGGGVNFNILFLRARAEYTRYEIEDSDFDSLSISALLKF